MERGQVLVSDDGLALAAWRNVFVNVWRLEATLARLELVRREQRRLIERFPDGVANLTVIEPRVFSKPIGSTEREQAAAIAKEMAPHTRAMAYVVEGTGFRTATARMVLAGVNMVSRAAYPMKVFDTVTDGARWVVTTLGGAAPEADGLLGCIGEARGVLPPAAVSGG
jgi:hypothetical protein